MNGLITRSVHQVTLKSRSRKHELFLSLMEPSAFDRVLDVGAEETEYSPVSNYLEKHYSWPEQITVASPVANNGLKSRYPQVTVVCADGCDLPFADNQFDIGYSNAVLEHVGSRERQIRFVKELHRVSKRGFLTTPNRLFPVESHSHLPLIHLVLPTRWQDALLRALGKGWATSDAIHLLSCQELRRVVEAAEIRNYSILATRVWGLRATFIVYWRKA